MAEDITSILYLFMFINLVVPCLLIVINLFIYENLYVDSKVGGPRSEKQDALSRCSVEAIKKILIRQIYLPLTI